MKKTNTTCLTEEFLTCYWLVVSVCEGAFDSNRRRAVYDRLADIYCLPEKNETYFSALEAAPFCTVTDTASYEQLCRVMEYARESGHGVAVSDTDRLLLGRMRIALQKKSAVIPTVGHLTDAALADTLIRAARNGQIDAMAVLSFLEYEGILPGADRERAVRRMRLCASWNDLFGLLFCLSCDDRYRDERKAALRVLLSHSALESAAPYLTEKLCLGEEGDETVPRLLEKAFGLGTVSREKYDPEFAAVAFSEVITAEDKKNLLLSTHRQALPALPFTMKRGGRIAFSADGAAALPPTRREEAGQILRNLAVAVRCPDAVYRPLLLAVGDGFVGDMYEKTIRKCLSGAAVCDVDAAMLAPEDLTPTWQNIFLRHLCATGKTDTVFFIRHCEELGKEQTADLLRLLDPVGRRSFKLTAPAVSFDLSGLRFVLFSRDRSYPFALLSEVCDTVFCEKTADEEKAAAVRSILSDLCRGFEDFKADLAGEDCVAKLMQYDTNDIRLILDRALRDAVYRDEGCITREELTEAAEELGLSRSRAEFGYMGGRNHAVD